MKTLGQKIKYLRKKKGVSQEELSFELDVSRQAISKWENDSMRPTSDNIKALCAFFKVESNYFLSEENETKEVQSETNDSLIDECATVANPSVSKRKTIIILISIIISAVIFIVSLMVGIIAIIITGQEDTGFETVSRFDFNWFGIVCFVIALIALISMIVLIVYKSKKKKIKM